MERTKTNATNPDVVTWKKIGGGSLRLGNKIIKPGQIFIASPSEIPPLFRNLVIPLGDVPKEKLAPTPAVKVTKSAYKMVPRGQSKTWFDVVDKNEKQMNEKALNKESALSLIKSLSTE